MPNYEFLSQLMYEGDLNDETQHRHTDPYLCLHSKGFTIDDNYSVIGSYNLDPRSQDYNTELLIVIKDTAFTKDYKNQLLRDAHPDNSWTVARRKRALLGTLVNGVFGFANDILKTFTTLDLWPMRHASCYELLPGKDAVDMLDPQFYDNYKHVGLFPEVDVLESKLFLTRITKFLGGILRPVL